MSDDIKIAIFPESWNRVVRERDDAREALRTLAEHGEIEIQKLIKERDEAREENKKFREALGWIAERYDDSKPTEWVVKSDGSTTWQWKETTK